MHVYVNSLRIANCVDQYSVSIMLVRYALTLGEEKKINKYVRREVKFLNSQIRELHR